MITSQLLGGVLVGGESRRMGRPKQLINVGGAAMVERVIGALQGEVDEVFLLGAGPVTANLADRSRLADAGDCRGPMAGILGALRARPNATWVIAACDLPKLRGEAVRWLVSSRQAEGWVVFPSIDGFVEPLPALYEPRARLLLERAAAAGDFGLHRLACDSRAVLAEPPAAFKDCWSNANTPRELARIIHDSSAAMRDALRVAAHSRFARSTYRKYASARSSFEIAATLAPRTFRDESSDNAGLNSCAPTVHSESKRHITSGRTSPGARWS